MYCDKFIDLFRFIYHLEFKTTHLITDEFIPTLINPKLWIIMLVMND